MSKVTGKRHTWINPRALGYSSLGDYESCRECGVVKGFHNVDALTCKGVVHVALRATDGNDGGRP